MKRFVSSVVVASVVQLLCAVPVAEAAPWPGFTCGMGIGGWLTNYKRFNVLPMEERLLLSEGDFEHFDGYITEADVRNIKEMGFDHVRLGFDQIVLEEAPGRYRERTFRKVDDFVGWCAKYDLGLVLNLHKAVGNYCDIAEDVSLMDDAKLQERFIALWLEFERRYHDRPKLVFELLNEVRDVDPAKWNDLADRAIRAIRAKNRDRWIVVGPTCWNNPPKLKELKVWDDPRVVYTFHMYWPFEFTHQRGVLQAGPLSYNRVLEYPSADVSRYVGYYKFHGWGDGPFADGRPVDRVRLAENLQPAFDFVKAHPDKILWNGEFGTIRHAPKQSRVAYMRDVVSLCKEHGIPWCVWNYLSTPNDGNRFSLVDDDTRKILSQELLDACLGEEGINMPVELKETKGVEAWVNCAEPGAWRLDVRREGGERPGVEVVRVTGRAERALKRPKLEVGFRRTDAGNVRTLWRTDLGNRKFSREGVLPWSWSNFETSFGYQMPLYAFLDSNDANVLTLASSDSRNRVGFRGGMEEGPNVMLAKFDFNDGEPETPTNAFEICVRCDSRALSADRVIPAAAEWMRKLDPSTDYPVPDAAFEPLWSSWCAYHWNETDAIVEREAEEAKKLGLTTVLIDWGWQNPPGKSQYFGEGLPAKRYTDDFAAHVKRLHDKGMTVTMWFPMTLFTEDCPIYESFRPHALCRRGWGPYAWDPRFAVRRDYFLACVERAVRDWKVDGLKIDFGDSWGIGYPDSKGKLPKLGDDLGGRDIRDLSEAAALVVGELRRRLTAMRPDLTIEFRQTYIGPGMCKGCTQVRVQDCPGSQREMRYGIANLRLTCGPNAVHSDPIQWNRTEPDEQVADSILASIFGIGQYSVRLTDETPSHKRLLARWVKFAKEHRSALYCGDFRVQGLTYDAPVLVGEDAAERIVGSYVPGFAADCGMPDKRVILLNGTGTDKVLVRFGAAATGTVLDMFGEKVGACQIPAGLSEVAIPRGGCLEVELSDSSRNNPPLRFGRAARSDLFAGPAGRAPHG